MKTAAIPVLAAALLVAGAVHAQDLTASDKPVVTVKAAEPDKPYAGITSRNMFGLVPIPVVDPATLNQPPPDPPPKITPNGIMTIFGKLQVLFKVATKPPPGQPQKDDAYVMTEGERQDEIEVVKIDGKAGVVTFNNHGTIQELSLEPAKNTGGPAGQGGGPRMPMPGYGRPPVAPGGGAGNSLMPAIGNNNAVGPGGRKVQMGGNQGGNQGGNPGSSGLGSGASSQSSETMSPEARYILMEAQRAQLIESHSPMAPIFPPTRLTGQLNPSAASPPIP